ncbi:MAG: ATP-grasp domain-containing protein [Caldilineae bacterium]|nr:MAG: ATP-grasp domain-containing protein [Caldilineae bacterium]
MTGAGGPLGQSILKAVRSASLPCHLITTDRHPLSVGFFWSDRHYVIASAEEPGYLPQLKSICRLEGVHAILIGSEGEMQVLSEARETFEREAKTRLIVSAPDVIRVANDKWKTVRFLAAHNLPYPRSALPEMREQLESLIADAGFPLIVKPRNGSGSKGVYRVEGRQELKRVLALVERPVVQEYLQPDNREYTAATFVDAEGRTQGAIVMRRELAAGLTYRAWVEENPPLACITRRIAEALKPLGPCNVQLRLTERGPVPFEINARFSSTTSMRAHFGYNEVEMALRCFVLGEDVRPQAPRPGIALRYWEEMYLPPPQPSSPAPPVARLETTGEME